MPDITFKHSDLTNSRELIYKLNNLTPQQGGGNGLYIVTCEYTGTGLFDFSDTFATITDKISEGYDVCIKMAVTESTPYYEYLFLSDIKPNIPSIVFTSTLNNPSAASKYYYTITVGTSDVSIEKVQLKSVEYFHATYDKSEDTFSTTVTLSDITNAISEGKLPVFKVYYEDDDAFVYYNQVSDRSFRGPVYFETIESVDYFLYPVITYVNNSSYTFSIQDQTLTTNNIYVETTYSGLVTLINNNNLTKGCKYCITDYVTTVNSSLTNIKSGNHPFMLVVTATSASQLSHDAYAVPVSGDTYFQYCDLSKWKISYDYNNDTDKYSWANSTSGKGVIYRMEDEYGNVCGYDFKNIWYKRWALNSNHPLYNVYFPYKSPVAVSTNGYIWTPTFGKFAGTVSDNDILVDMTVQEVCCMYSNYVHNSLYENSLPNIAFINGSSSASLSYITKNNTVDYSSNITFFGIEKDNKLNRVSDCIMSSDINDNQLNCVSDCNIDNDFKNNVINNTSSITFGTGFKNNFVLNTSSSTIGNNYQNCIFENSSSLTFNSTLSIVKNLKVRNVSSYTLNGDDLTSVTNKTYENIISKNSDGTVKIYCLADLIR